MILASSFAQTPAGYITGVGLPILAMVIGGVVVRAERHSRHIWAELEQLKTALNVNTQALAVIVQQATDDRPMVSKIPDLDRSVAVLQDRLNRHEQWARDEHTRIRDAERPRPVRTYPGGTP